MYLKIRWKEGWDGSQEIVKKRRKIGKNVIEVCEEPERCAPASRVTVDPTRWPLPRSERRDPRAGRR